MIRITHSLAVLAWMSAGASEAAQLRQGGFGCKSLASAEQLVQLQRAGDPSGFQDRLGKLTGIGECRLWAPGEQVVSRDQEDSLACFAAKDTGGHCYWSVKALAQ